MARGVQARTMRPQGSSSLNLGWTLRAKHGNVYITLLKVVFGNLELVIQSLDSKAQKFSRWRTRSKGEPSFVTDWFTMRRPPACSFAPPFLLACQVNL
ncbi:hypothetical protein E2C01_093202 [Portunus trituberculatus]|uniref:Uncharacterized protein n=1 Tax=Portunus trituberculatus TaxID=210409 RepID=A0A5B7JZW6_PORTR|nr:hypothetical protein [Portunus trituberculatus]